MGEFLKALEDMRLIFQFDPANQHRISFFEASNADRFLQKSLHPSSLIIGSSFLSLIPEEERQRISEIIQTLGPQNPVTMTEHNFQQQQGGPSTHRVLMKTLFMWIFDPPPTQEGGEEGAPKRAQKTVIQSVSQVWFHWCDSSGQLLSNTILKSMPDMFFKLNKKDLTFMDFFARDDSLLAAPAALLLGKSIYEVMPQEISGDLIQTCFDVVKTGKQGSCEYLLQLGKPTWFEARVFLEKSEEDGQEEHLVSVVRDITLQKELELKLKRVTSMLQSIIDECPAIICVKNSKNESVLTNQTYNRLISPEDSESDILRYSQDPPANPLEGTFHDFSDGEAKELTFVIHRFLLTQTGGRPQGHPPRIQPDENFQPNQPNKQEEEERHPESLMCLMGMEITDRIHFEKKLLQRTQELERLNNDLRLAREMAEEAVRAKLMLMASLSHEIRTPLNGVIGTTSLLSLTELSKDQKELVDTIQVSGETLLQIINDLLDLAKMDSGKLTLEDKPFCLVECIEGVFNLVAAQAKERGVDLFFNILPGVPEMLVGDVLRLRQILLNLVSNAIKFSRKGFVSMQCFDASSIAIPPSATFSKDDEKIAASAFESFSVSLLDSIKLCFQVVDDGIGIPQEKMFMLFQPFSQVDPSTSRNYGGTGLGLAICRRLTKVMGGSIWVESQVNEGSTFTFTANFRTSEKAPVPQETSTLPKITTVENKNLIIAVALIGSRNFAKMLEGWLSIWQITFEIMLLEGSQHCPEFILQICDGMLTKFKGIKTILILDDSIFQNDGDGIFSTTQKLSEAGWQVALVGDLNSAEARRRSLDGEMAARYHESFRKPLRVSKLSKWMDELVRGIQSEGKVSLVIPKDPLQPKRERSNSSSTNTEGGVEQKKKKMAQFKLRALVAEDNQVNQLLLKKILTKYGCQVDVADDGVSAVKAVKDVGYEIVMMDVNMPKMNGIEATTIIHKELKERHLRPMIVAVTANALDENRQACLEAGMDDFICKPFVLEDVERVLWKCAERKS